VSITTDFLCVFVCVCVRGKHFWQFLFLRILYQDFWNSSYHYIKIGFIFMSYNLHVVLLSCSEFIILLLHVYKNYIQWISFNFRRQTSTNMNWILSSHIGTLCLYAILSMLKEISHCSNSKLQSDFPLGLYRKLKITF